MIYNVELTDNWLEETILETEEEIQGWPSDIKDILVAAAEVK